MQAPGCGGDTGNTHREFPEGSHVGALEVFTVTSGIRKVDSYPLLFKRQAAAAPRLPPLPTLVFPIGLGPYQFIRDGGPARPPAARGLREALVTRLTSAPCSSFWGHCPAQGPWHTGLPSSLCSTTSGKLLSAPVDLITAGPIPHDTMRS